MDIERKIDPVKMALSIPAVFTSHKRSKRRVYPKYALLKMQSVTTRESALKYKSHAVSFTKIDGSTTEGVITNAHGNSGVVVAKFKKNLRPQDVGKIAFVKLYKINVDEI